MARRRSRLWNPVCRPWIMETITCEVGAHQGGTGIIEHMSIMERTVGDVLRDWRRRRHFSQLDLAVEAEVSTRHLSFLETGRSQPSRDLLLRLADSLDVPLRERNALLLAGGFAPVFPERPISDPALAAAQEAVDLILKGHEPYPALAIDRYWTC